MPEIIAELTQMEAQIKSIVHKSFNVNEICSYLLSKKLQCINKFDDSFIDRWYSKYFKQEKNSDTDRRKSLILYFSSVIVGEQNYDSFLEFWIRRMQFDIIEDMKHFHSCSSCTFQN